jgi:hypothetical protein
VETVSRSQGYARGVWGVFGPASRWAAVSALSVALVFGAGGTAIALPPPPPNPSDSEINESRAEERARAGEVGQLTNDLANAESRLADLQAEVALKLEEANKAMVDMQAAKRCNNELRAFLRHVENNRSS